MFSGNVKYIFLIKAAVYFALEKFDFVEWSRQRPAGCFRQRGRFSLSKKPYENSGTPEPAM